MTDASSLGKIEGLLQGLQADTTDIKQNMVRRDVFTTWQSDVNGQIAQLRIDLANAEARANEKIAEAKAETKRVRDDFDGAGKAIEMAGKSRVNMWITGGLAVVGSALVKLFVPSP